jgi:glycosyl transferase family 25
MEQLLKNYGMETAERFPAIEHAYGLYGCGLSHLNVLKKAREQKWDNVLILEDDIIFREDLCPNKETLHTKLTEMFAAPGWDVFMLDMNLRASFTDAPTACPDSMFRIRFAHCAGAYLVKSHYYDKLIELYEWALPQLNATQMHWVYANDAIWTRLQETDQWWGFKQQFCIQMGGYSDTKNMVTGVGGSI